MSNPMSSPAPDFGRGPRFNACFDALRQWRDNLVREGRIPLGVLKEAHLKNAIMRGRRDERLVAAMLPGDYSYLARDMVAVILRTDPVNAPSAADPPAPADEWPTLPVGPTQRPVAESAGAAKATPESDRVPDAAAFAALDFSEDLGNPGALRVAYTAGGTRLTWDDTDTVDGEVALYRVVSTDDYPGYAPEFAELVTVTRERTATDLREFSAAVRYFQVWRNTGPRIEEAVVRQPRLHAQSAVVAPIQGLSLREDAGRVIGQWAVFPGVTRVHVYRIPIERAAQAGLDPQYRIAPDETNLSGFIDREATRGKRYLYRFCAEASIDGVARLSPAVGQAVAVSALLTPVDDLSVRSYGTADDWLFDLEWTNPVAGRVLIYRTQSPPSAGLDLEVLDESALPGGGLTVASRLVHPTHPGAEGRTGMREVPSPSGWDRVYFTPVTMIEGRARVGRSVSQVVIPLPGDPVIVERTFHQVLKFNWPGNAAAVAVGIGPRGAPATTPQEGPGYLEVGRDAYQRQGGLQFAHRLNPRGCTVHLAGISFVNRERTYGGAVSVSYPGLLQLFYTTEFKRNLMLVTDRVLIRVSADRELDNCPPFVLIHNADRLPLHVADGERLPTVLNVDQVAAPAEQFRPARLTTVLSDIAYRASVRGRSGYLRLFVDIDPDMLRHVALLDPAVHNLAIPR